MNEIKHVAIYLRISREKQETEDTLQSHRERLTRLCNERNYNYTIFEEVISGHADMEDRVALTQMLDTLHLYDALVVVDVYRIARRLKIAAEVYEKIEKLNIPIITPDKQYNMSDIMVLKFQAILAEEEYKHIVKIMLAGKVDKTLRKENVNARPPFGYDAVKIDGKRTFVPNQYAETVKEIFNLALNGYGTKHIAEMVDKPAKSVHCICTNEGYTGTIIYKDLRVEDAFEPIISKDDFIKVQEGLKSRNTLEGGKRGRFRGKVLNILKDILYCDECGNKLFFQMSNRNTNHPSLMVRNCTCGKNKGIKADKIMNDFYSQIDYIELMLREEWQKVLNTPVIDTTEIFESQIQDLEKKKTKLTKRLSNAKEMRLDGEINRVEFEEIKNDIGVQLQDLDKSIAEISSRIDSLDKTKVSNEYQEKLELIGRINSLKSIPSKGTFPITTLPLIEDKEQANRLLRLLLDKVFLGWETDENGIEDFRLTVLPKKVFNI
ncbi:recombinase family protein [Clostridium sp. CX1]|uniref:Recombinase family protein n=1 Tax=Clostridium tanneri TaxID=3037988 RepID=A0ABU4JQG1_9CLOT|nr:MULTISPECIES: recombinase family protein [unclassified Clostridium]MCT8975295.1 recombinase family protein [Clostridium sp. CX1]MDW8800219.1 recombinase family protein [Clostridium sp. A1-XYC3]